ncbi:MAG: Na(+)/H(+) antiporter subunit C [Acidimicrobiales bacterium]
MIVLLAITSGVLFAAGTYLILQRALTRVVIGIAILGHGANLLLLASGGRAGQAPFVSAEGVSEGFSDPLPQALALTAIVITFGVGAFLLTLAYRSWTLTHDDEVENDIEDRRIARRRRESDEFRHPGDADVVEDKPTGGELPADSSGSPGAGS